MRRQAERAGRDRASALKSAASRCLSTLGLLSSGVVGVAASHPACERAGSIPGLSMPMCACVWDSLLIPALLSFGFAVRLAKGGCFHRGRVPNVTFESYIESRKLSVPGRDQQEQLRVQRAWRPHSLRRSEHEPKECAGSCSAAAGCLTSRLSPICRQAIGPSSGLFSLWANERGLEKRSSTCRAQFSALKLCHGPLGRPFCFLSAAGALLWLVLAVGKGVRARPFGL